MHKYLILIQAIDLNLWPQANSRINKCFFYSLPMSYRSALKVMLYIFRWLCLCNPDYLISLGQLPVCFRTSQREQKAPFQPCGTIPRPSELSTSIFILLFFFPLTLVVLLPWQSVVITAISSCHLYTKGFSHLISQAISYYISVPPTVMTGFPFLLDTLFIKIESIFS